MGLRHRLHRIVFVPLDDRPVNLKVPRLLAQMVDYELVTPPVELLGHFQLPGNPDEIATWVVGQVAGPTDCALLSLDMLAYGGLVASRGAGVRTALAEERLNALSAIRARAPELTIYAFNVIMRLSITARSDETAQYWELVRRYSELRGKATDRGDEAAQAQMQELEEQIPAAILGEYLAVRARNHEINLRAIREVATGNLDLLVLCQEDAAEFGLHQQEQRSLRQLADELGVSDRVLIYPGADEVGATLLVRFIHEHMLKSPSVRVIYPEGHNGTNIAEFEDRPFADSVAAHIQAVGARQTMPDEEPDLLLAVNPPAGCRREEADAAARGPMLQAFAQQIADLSADRGVAVCDAAFPNGAEDAFAQALIEAGVKLPRLLSFAAWNTASNALGSALAHGTLRVIGLQDKGAFDLAQLLTGISPMRYLELLNSLIDSEKAHIQLLFTRLVDDWLYQSRVRPEVTDHTVKLLRASVFDLRDSHQAAEQMVRDRLTHAAADLWIDHFLGCQCAQIGPADERSGLMLAELEETHVRLPWQRLFEVDLDFDFGMELVAREQ